MTEVPQPLPPLSPDELAVVSRLSDLQRRAMDAALLAEVLPHWRKVAMVVGCAMGRPSHVPGVTDTYYGQRVCALVGEGQIEVQGNVEYMRFSEVRLWPRKDGASHDSQ